MNASPSSDRRPRELDLGELAAIEQVAPPTITKIVSKLEEDGLVSRTVDERDRRVARVTVSQAGQARLDATRSRRDAWLSQRLDEVGADDIDRLVAALDVLEALASGPDRAADHTSDRPVVP